MDHETGKKELKTKWIAYKSGVIRYFSSSLQIIRQAILWVVPCLMVSSFLVFIGGLGDFFSSDSPGWIDAVYKMNRDIMDIFPYLLTVTISYLLAMHWRLPRSPVVLLSIVYLVMAYELMNGDGGDVIVTYGMVMSMITPFYTVPALALLQKVSWLRLTQIDSAGQMVKETLNMVIPALITGFIVVLVNILILEVLHQIPLFELVIFDYANEPYLFGTAFAALNSAFWFVGIHGYYALLPMVEQLQEAMYFNQEEVLAGGQAFFHMNVSLMGAFVFIGGSGATFSLILAILMVSREKKYKIIALASIPIALFNVNELLLFGLPIILNPRLFIPFFLVPIVNVMLSMFAVETGLVASPSVAVPFNSPVIVNALIATNGDTSAVVLQLFNVLIGMFIYMPAVIRMERHHISQYIDFKSLDTSYMRRTEEALTLMDDPVAQANNRQKQNAQMESALDAISSKEFYLEYQPQVCRRSEKVCGCEALIRAKDETGKVEMPGHFIPWFEKADMMKDIDLWVARTAVQDIRTMRRQGIDISVSINVSPQTMMNETYMSELLEIIESEPQSIHVEITEDALLIDQSVLIDELKRLHTLGVKVLIDDFGTGFSSFSYLSKFDVDAIKIDRSFVLALDNIRGQKVFSSLMGVADSLDLSIVVEGVETTEQLNFLPKEEDIYIQGWYYSRSLPLDEFVEFCKSR